MADAWHVEQVPTACFVQPPLSFVGLSEEEAVEKLAGPLDIYSSLFRPLKNTLTGREEKTFVKMIVHVPTDRVRTLEPSPSPPPGKPPFV